ncbi:MAG: glutamine synthetase III [Deltaproteobacteria bacterium]|nr:glutamine synthetase III [Deltaproteobacteria bacterium]MBI3293284.1 glutamine synthetase III [Deltaproteobacteria bacterium]
MHQFTFAKTRSQPVSHHAKERQPISEYFGELTFGLGQMRDKLPREAYQGLIRTLEQGKKLTKETADDVALAVKEWSVAKGCTHFCHWFQPMTGLTAEKHDAFISIQRSYHSELGVMEKFTGGQLIQGEPDASSFPSGGMRSTFEARGYTAWDPSSPMFILEGEHGHTLCIPTVFFGYHGEALDNKTPLLRSAQALSKEASEFLKLIGDVDVKTVTATLGTEQEYFVIDRSFVSKRPDLILTGRTLLGAPSPRGQQLEDHYFGAIPTRVKAFMEDAEVELYKLGVPIKTRHNEVAPSQFEVAPIFENANIASDHNTLTMDVLKRVAIRHGLTCLIHEKPFAGINGSGKHCNWSVCNDKGENLLDPGNTPHQNLRMLAVTTVVLKAVFDHCDALRASIASPGNDHRLGGNEAPPAIISVFLGSLLDKILNSIEKGEAAKATEQQIISLGVSQIPDISKDYTDRNRTSPFAFTGNKFEFRAVGSSANVAVPVTILNTAAADSFKKATTRLKELLAKKSGRDEAVMELIKELAKESKAIRFEGNGYSLEWQKEAKARKLPIFDTTVEALEVFNTPKAIAFLVDNNVLSKPEIESRYHIAVERYVKTVEIEMSTCLEMAMQYVIPTVESQLVAMDAAHKTLSTTTAKKLHGARMEALEEALEQILTSHKTLKSGLEKLHEEKSEATKAKTLSTELMEHMRKLRAACDSAETMTADSLWPLPKYREMLFAHTIA